MVVSFVPDYLESLAVEMHQSWGLGPKTRSGPPLDIPMLQYITSPDAAPTRLRLKTLNGSTTGARCKEAEEEDKTNGDASVFARGK